ncbi:MAG TPA: nickel pincer cofactor biosynthesis protein LarB [Pirellulales bacterium]|nr:nickel pincer cofactor biosynthesis protein LarB [Pirellulales bacterium]
MQSSRIEQLAKRLLDGKLALEEFVRQAESPATADLDEAQLDLDRARRCGYPEVVYGAGKSRETLEKIFRRFSAEGIDALATRINAEQAAHVTEIFPDARYNSLAQTLRLPSPANNGRAARGRVTVVTAGTSDLPVAEEARETLEWMGVEVTMVFDVGVAGPHRLIERLAEFECADAVVVVAGMEGALPSVVGGHVPCPVIAVPTSVGYGANFGGVAALLSMLNSCAANVSVVNIDAGFKGGYLAGLIASRANTKKGDANLFGLDHVQVAIPRGSEPQARAFYGGLLGLREIEKPPALKNRGGVWYQLGDGRQLHLGVEEPFSPSKKAHPCFAVPSLDELAKLLKQNTLPVTWDEAIAAARRFHTEDPFGNRLEFVK